MILRVRGKAVNVSGHLVGPVTRDINNQEENALVLIEDEIRPLPKVIGQAILTTQRDIEVSKDQIFVYKIPRLDHLDDGDLISVGNDGNINTLYRLKSEHNTLLVTERCNSNCIMCSQPPRDRDDIPLIADIHKRLIPLIPKDCKELGISGGEPTLLGSHFVNLIEQCKRELPQTSIHVLTNGRTFAWDQIVQEISALNHPDVMYGIPLYSDYYQQHDYIVQSENAFYQTMIGLHNMARYNLRTEIRVVLHKQTIPRLPKLAEYIFKNLPFAEHVAFMGLEFVGYTPHNIEELWIDPYHYQNELKEAVSILSSQGMNVSIYNTPLCLLPEELWDYARQSISDWKNKYQEECQSCSMKEDCSGFFTWNLKKSSDYVKAIKLPAEYFNKI